MIKLRVSDYLYPLHALGYLGHVHSVFKTSFNLLIGTQLVHVSCQEDFISSFGLLMPKADYQLCQPYLQVGNLVTIREDELVIYSHQGCYRLSFIAEKECLNVTSIDLTDTMEKVTWLKSYLEKEVRKGIGLLLPEKVEQVLTCSSVSAQDLEEAVSYLIGRGKGLTPSGDDVLVAYMLILSSYAQIRFQQLVPIIFKQLQQTTAVSQAYLKACLDGYVSSPIYRLLVSLSDDQLDNLTMKTTVERIRSIGHTSGSDLLLGIWLGLRFIILCSKEELSNES